MRKMNGMLMTLADGSNTISGKPAHSILLRSLRLHLAVPQDFNHGHLQLGRH
jgi:hypothetical protein